MMSEKLRIETLKVLQKKRIDVQCSMLVTGYDGETLSYRPMNAPKNAPCSTLKAKTVVWSAGVRPVDCLSSFACEKDRGKRLLIDDTIRVPGMQDVFAIGDCSSYTPPGEQRPLPTLAPVALAEGELAAKNILHDVRGEEMEHLHYKSKGVMAIIGNSEASWKQALCAAAAFSPGRPGSGSICSRKQASMPISPSRLNGFSIIFRGHALAA